MAWHGYALLELSAALADGMTAAQRDKARDGLRKLITIIRRAEDRDDFPPYVLQVRWALNKRALIIEGNFDATSKSEVVKKLAAELGVTQTAVNNALTITVFGAAKRGMRVGQRVRRGSRQTE